MLKQQHFLSYIAPSLLKFCSHFVLYATIYLCLMNLLLHENKFLGQSKSDEEKSNRKIIWINEHWKKLHLTEENPYIISQAENQYHSLAFLVHENKNKWTHWKKEKKTQTSNTASKWSVFDPFHMTNRMWLTFHSILYGSYILSHFNHHNIYT